MTQFVVRMLYTGLEELDGRVVVAVGFELLDGSSRIVDDRMESIRLRQVVGCVFGDSLVIGAVAGHMVRIRLPWGVAI